ncbi:hypothetical protein F4604DRAFT_1915687 [Suillus subluteus]|nr:hypothetical protein F4604DRAFT_1915687 [Suillus subluteus]
MTHASRRLIAAELSCRSSVVMFTIIHLLPSTPSPSFILALVWLHLAHTLHPYPPKPHAEAQHIEYRRFYHQDNTDCAACWARYLPAIHILSSTPSPSFILSLVWLHLTYVLHPYPPKPHAEAQRIEYGRFHHQDDMDWLAGAITFNLAVRHDRCTTGGLANGWLRNIALAMPRYGLCGLLGPVPSILPSGTITAPQEVL